MASLADKIAADRRFSFVSEAYSDNPFEVVSLDGHEAISRLFQFDLVLVSDNAAIDFSAMLNRPACLRIHAADGSGDAPYHGILSAFEQLHRAGGYVFYRAVLAPRLSRLALFRVSDVYLDEQTIPAIIEGVLHGSRVSRADYAMTLTGAYRQRSFVCQYEETNLDFISRWMEKEGIHYYFDHDNGHDRLMVIDRREALPMQAMRSAYRPVDELDAGIAPDSVQSFIHRRKPLPHRVLLQEYNYRKADLELLAEAVVDADGVGDFMIYGENFRDQEEGRRYAALRAEELVCAAHLYCGESTVAGLRSGRFMELAGHYRDDFNARYLVTEVQHSGSQAGALLAGIRSPFSEEGKSTFYRNSFQAIPEMMQFRAARFTPRPKVAGTMSARIDSEGEGDHAEMDEFGQYKVQLPFDRPGKAANRGSARVRMASPYSGSDHGMHFPLYKGAEVLLSFTDGDPDQPVIMGSVPNSSNPSLVSNANAAANGISTKGGNQLYMGDAKGKEVMWLHSPFHNSSIGIGSTDPKGGGSLAFFTAGSKDSITVGTSYDVTIGAKSSVFAGTNTELKASTNTSVALGGTLNFSFNSTAEYKLHGSSSYTVDDSSTSVVLSKNSNQSAYETMTLRGGADAAVVQKVEAAKSVVRRTAIATSVVNLLWSTGTAALISAPGKKGADGKLDFKYKDGDKDKHNAYAIGGALAETVPKILGVAAAWWRIRKAMDALADLQKNASYAGTLELGPAGAALEAKVPKAAVVAAVNVPLAPAASIVSSTFGLGSSGIKGVADISAPAPSALANNAVPIPLFSGIDMVAVVTAAASSTPRMEGVRLMATDTQKGQSAALTLNCNYFSLSEPFGKIISGAKATSFLKNPGVLVESEADMEIKAKNHIAMAAQKNVTLTTQEEMMLDSEKKIQLKSKAQIALAVGTTTLTLKAGALELSFGQGKTVTFNATNPIVDTQGVLKLG